MNDGTRSRCCPRTGRVPATLRTPRSRTLGTNLRRPERWRPSATRVGLTSSRRRRRHLASRRRAAADHCPAAGLCSVLLCMQVADRHDSLRTQLGVPRSARHFACRPAPLPRTCRCEGGLFGPRPSGVRGGSADSARAVQSPGRVAPGLARATSGDHAGRGSRGVADD
jgi:hypothetical protein